MIPVLINQCRSASAGLARSARPDGPRAAGPVTAMLSTHVAEYVIEDRIRDAADARLARSGAPAAARFRAQDRPRFAAPETSPRLTVSRR